MGRKEETIVTYTCDRCGHETSESDDRRTYEAGTMTIKGSSTTAGMSFGGDWGGHTTQIDHWYCLDCRQSFWKWFRQEEQE